MDQIEQAREVPEEELLVKFGTRLEKSTLNGREDSLLSKIWSRIGNSTFKKIILLVIFVFVVLAIIVPNITIQSPNVQTKESSEKNRPWYRLYCRSFRDSDSDGRGDFEGIAEKISYLVQLNISVIWMDVYDKGLPQIIPGNIELHLAISDTDFGNLTQLVQDIQKAGMQIVLDLNPYFTIKNHIWFENSVRSTIPLIDFYIWKNASYSVDGKRHPPDNRVSTNNNSLWTWNENRQAYYYQDSDENKPILNLGNPNVIEQIKNIIKILLEIGVNGIFVKDPRYLYDDDQHMACDVLDNISSTIEEYNRQHPESKRFLVVEGSLLKNCSSLRNKTFHIVDDLYYLPSNFTGHQLKMAIENVLNETSNRGQLNWVLGNEERSRIASKFGPRAIGLQIVQLLLPGHATIYYGDEIQLVDKTNRSTVYQNKTIPSLPFISLMPWDSNAIHAGFSEGKKIYLPHDDLNRTSVQRQNATQESALHAFQKIIQLRKFLSDEHFNFQFVNEDVFSFNRTKNDGKKSYLIFFNCGKHSSNITIDTPNPKNLLVEMIIDSSNIKKPLRDNTNVNLYNSHTRTMILEPFHLVIFTHEPPVKK